MQYITDLHFHSKYSRAVSQQMNLENCAEWAVKKGIQVVAACDFTHPEFFSEIKQKLKPQENGLLKLKDSDLDTRFLLGTEISCIYSKNNKGYRIHVLVWLPDLEAVEKFNTQLNWVGNLKSDGRPILGMDVRELTKIAFEVSDQAAVIPAHAWTPWFSLFGSESGFDSIKDCFEEYTEKIYAIETGLSSDPAMNWRLSQLDGVSIVSFSDAHSLQNLGREATVFELEELSYQNILRAIKLPVDPKNKIEYTIEFYPEEGKYHWDGHRNCDVRFSPQETTKNKGICPACKKRVTVGVMNRVAKLADREAMKEAPEGRPLYKSLVPLQEIIAEALGQNKGTKAVDQEYESLVRAGGGEFNVLMNASENDLKKMTLPKVADGISKVRNGDIVVEAGYDGVVGTVKVWTEEEQESETDASGQKSLF
jgi:uncharacterized protein (TIGR00375 family)